MRAIRFNPHDEGAHPKFDLAHCPSGDELRVFPGTILGYSLSRRVWSKSLVIQAKQATQHRKFTNSTDLANTSGPRGGPTGRSRMGFAVAQQLGS